MNRQQPGRRRQAGYRGAGGEGSFLDQVVLRDHRNAARSLHIRADVQTGLPWWYCDFQRPAGTFRISHKRQSLDLYLGVLTKYNRTDSLIGLRVSKKSGRQPATAPA